MTMTDEALARKNARNQQQRVTDDHPGVLRQWRCHRCNRVMAEYVPPVCYLKHRCRVCGTWNVLTTETKPP